LSPEDLTKLCHILDASRKAVKFSQGRRRTELDSDEMLSLALVRLLEIIGEAAKGVSSSVRQHYAEIPWKDIAGTRDRLIHGYYDVDLDIVWSIIINDLPPLIIRLEEIVKNAEN
jgi:uncharacterized protein with HEPN domain